MRTVRNGSFVLMLLSVVIFGVDPVRANWEACSIDGGESACCLVGFTFDCNQYCVASGYGSGDLEGSCSAEVGEEDAEGEVCWCEGPQLE